MKKTYWKILQYGISGLLLLYVTIISFPQKLFGYTIEYKNFIVYSKKPLNNNKLYTILDNVEDKIKLSEVYDSTMLHEIFFCDNFSDYTFFAPLSQTAFACYYPFNNNIYLSKTDLKQDLIKRKGSNSERTISGTIAHEVTHALIENELGAIYVRLSPDWKNEGYCDYIAKESSIDYNDGLELLCADNLNHKYFQYRLFIEYLIEGQNNSFWKFFNEDYDMEDLKEKVKNEYCPIIGTNKHISSGSIKLDSLHKKDLNVD